MRFGRTFLLRSFTARTRLQRARDVLMPRKRSVCFPLKNGLTKVVRMADVLKMHKEENASVS